MAAALLGRCHAGSDAPLCAVKRRLTLQFPREAVHQPITYRLAVDYDVASRIIRALISLLRSSIRAARMIRFASLNSCFA